MKAKKILKLWEEYKRDYALKKMEEISINFFQQDHILTSLSEHEDPAVMQKLSYDLKYMIFKQSELEENLPADERTKNYFNLIDTLPSKIKEFFIIMHQVSEVFETNIFNKLQEVKAFLKNCDTYEQRIEILLKHNVITEDFYIFIDKDEFVNIWNHIEREMEDYEICD